MVRFDYGPHETMSRLEFPDGSQVLLTIERKWASHPIHGSQPNISCVPDGLYELIAHNGAKYKDTYALHNPDLKVYATKGEWEENKEKGRHTCVLHVANWARDVKGCIGPGLVRKVLRHPEAGFEVAVTSSEEAMERFRKEAKKLEQEGKKLYLRIKPFDGARIR